MCSITQKEGAQDALLVALLQMNPPLRRRLSYCGVSTCEVARTEAFLLCAYFIFISLQVDDYAVFVEGAPSPYGVDFPPCEGNDQVDE